LAAEKFDKQKNPESNYTLDKNCLVPCLLLSVTEAIILLF